MMHDLERTIVAVATAPGRSGIGCLRVSGPAAHALAVARFEAAGPRPVAGGSPCFGKFTDGTGQPIDHGYLVLFAAGRSYSGEATAELWTHGSPPVLRALVATLCADGAEPAEPGEFTYRAVRHGRLDLTRAEAVRDLIEARTAYQARVALEQAEGAIVRRLAPLRDALEEWLARTEAAIEFVDESETHLQSAALHQGLVSLVEQARELQSGFARGRLVREGARLAIVGRPNVGKSSLFNRLLEDDRAIVSPQAGTTRDTLEESFEVGGIPLRLIDTAGLHDSGDPVEGEGIRRARRARAEAEIVLEVVVAGEAVGEPPTSSPAAVGATLQVVNKIDLTDQPPGRFADRAVRVSARTGEGLDELREELRRCLAADGALESGAITNARQAGCVDEAVAALERSRAWADRGDREELVAEELRRALCALGTITGEFTTEDLYDRLFSTFCIGK